MKFSHLSLSDGKMRIADLPKNQNKLLCHISSLNFVFGERVNARSVAKSRSLSNPSMCVLTEFSIPFFSSAVTFYYVIREQKTPTVNARYAVELCEVAENHAASSYMLYSICERTYLPRDHQSSTLSALLSHGSHARHRRGRWRRHHHDTHRKCNAQRLRKRNLKQISSRFSV